MSDVPRFDPQRALEQARDIPEPHTAPRPEFSESKRRLGESSRRDDTGLNLDQITGYEAPPMEMVRDQMDQFARMAPLLEESENPEEDIHEAAVSAYLSSRLNRDPGEVRQHLDSYLEEYYGMRVTPQTAFQAMKNALERGRIVAEVSENMRLIERGLDWSNDQLTPEEEKRFEELMQRMAELPPPDQTNRNLITRIGLNVMEAGLEQTPRLAWALTRTVQDQWPIIGGLMAATALMAIPDPATTIAGGAMLKGTLAAQQAATKGLFPYLKTVLGYSTGTGAAQLSASAWRQARAGSAVYRLANAYEGATFMEIMSNVDADGNRPDPRLAAISARAAGTLAGATEFMSLSLIPGAQNVFNTVQSRVLTSILAKGPFRNPLAQMTGRLAGYHIGRQANEWAQETAQIIGTELAKELDRGVHNREWDRYTADEIMKRWQDISRQVWYSSWMFAAPGTAMSVAGATMQGAQTARATQRLQDLKGQVTEGLDLQDVDVQQTIEKYDAAIQEFEAEPTRDNFENAIRFAAQVDMLRPEDQERVFSEIQHSNPEMQARELHQLSHEEWSQMERISADNFEMHLREAAPHLRDEEVRLGRVMLEQFSKRAGLSFDQYVQSRLAGPGFVEAPRVTGVKGTVQITRVADYVQGIIHLGETSDFSTFMHEVMHIEERRAHEGQDSIISADDYAALREWAESLVDDPDYTRTQLDEGDPGYWTHEQFIAEKIAEGFEAYLHEGRVPNERLRTAFERIADFFREIYEAVLRHLPTLNDDVRSAFDNIFGEEVVPPRTAAPQNQEGDYLLDQRENREVYTPQTATKERIVQIQEIFNREKEIGNSPENLNTFPAMVNAIIHLSEENPRLELSPDTFDSVVQTASRGMYQDLVRPIRENDRYIIDSRNWYDQDVAETRRMLSIDIPELADDRYWTAFLAILSSTSSGHDPVFNLFAASSIMKYWLRTRTMPTEHIRVGDRWSHKLFGMLIEGNLGLVQAGRPFMAVQMDNLNTIAQKLNYDIDAISGWLLGTHTGREITEMLDGRKPNSINLTWEYQGFEYLGPKLGQYALALYGDRDMVVKDRWFSRTWNRYLGTPWQSYNMDESTARRGKREPEELIADTPRNPTERRAMDQAVNQTRELLSAEFGEEFTNSEVQAMLWFLEKRLHRDLGVSGAVAASSYSDAAIRRADVIQNWYVPTSGEGFLETAPDPQQLVEQLDREGIDRTRLHWTEAASDYLTSPQHVRAIDGPLKDNQALFHQLENTNTPQFREWFRDSVVTGRMGRPLQVYHVSQHEFEAFDTRVFRDISLGSHFGTTRQAETVFGPPFAARQMMQMGSTPQMLTMYPVYLSIQNPIRLEDRGHWGTVAVLPQLYDRGLLTPQEERVAEEIQWLRDRGHRIDDGLNQEGLNIIFDVFDRMRYDGVEYLNRHEGLDSPESIGQLAQDLGYGLEDIHLMTDEQFMDFMEEVGYPINEDQQRAWIALESEQIKSVFNPNRFDPIDPRLLHQRGEISLEARPGQSWNENLTWMNSLTYEQQRELMNEVYEALQFGEGLQALAREFGVEQVDNVEAVGVWLDEMNPSMQLQIEYTELTPSTIDQIESFAATLGFLLRQDGVGWNAVVEAPEDQQTGIVVDAGRTLTQDEMRVVAGYLNRLSEGDLIPVGAPEGLHILNFSDVAADEVAQGLAEALSEVMADEADIYKAAIESGLVENNWQEAPNGEGYIQRIAAAGAQELFERSVSVLGERVDQAYRRFEARHRPPPPQREGLTDGESFNQRERDTSLRSALRLAADLIPRKQGTPAEMLAALKKGPHVTQEEITVSGVEEFMAGKKTVTRDELIDYLQNQAPRITEVHLHEFSDAYIDAKVAQEVSYRMRAAGLDTREGYSNYITYLQHLADQARERGQRFATPELAMKSAAPRATTWAEGARKAGSSYRWLVNEIKKDGYFYESIDDVHAAGLITDEELQTAKDLERQRAVVENTEQQIKSLARQEYSILREHQRAKYAGYQVPGGRNYRELLFRFHPTPVNRPRANALRNQIKQWADDYGISGSEETALNEVRMAISLEEREQMVRMLKEAVEEWKSSFDVDHQYGTEHWDESNILSWVRFNEREVDGADALFLEEVQSDWVAQYRALKSKAKQSVQAITNKHSREVGRWLSFEEALAYEGDTTEASDAIERHRAVGGTVDAEYIRFRSAEIAHDQLVDNLLEKYGKELPEDLHGVMSEEDAAELETHQRWINGDFDSLEAARRDYMSEEQALNLMQDLWYDQGRKSEVEQGLRELPTEKLARRLEEELRTLEERIRQTEEELVARAPASLAMSQQYRRRMGRLRRKVAAERPLGDDLPQPPIDQNWTRTIFRRMIMEAAKQDKGVIAWTGANLQARRWASDIGDVPARDQVYDEFLPSHARKMGKKYGVAPYRTRVAEEGETMAGMDVEDLEVRLEEEFGVLGPGSGEIVINPQERTVQVVRNVGEIEDIAEHTMAFRSSSTFIHGMFMAIEQEVDVPGDAYSLRANVVGIIGDQRVDQLDEYVAQVRAASERQEETRIPVGASDLGLAREIVEGPETEALDSWAMEIPEQMKEDILGGQDMFLHQTASSWWFKGDQVFEADSTHIRDVLSNPERYGFTKQELVAIYKEHGEKIGQEARAREEIIKKLNRKNWVRVRHYTRPQDYWSLTVGDLRRQQKNVVDFIFYAMENLGLTPNDQLQIVSTETNEIQTYRFQEGGVKKAVDDLSLQQRDPHYREVEAAVTRGEWVEDSVLAEYADAEWAEFEIQARSALRQEALAFDDFDEFLGYMATADPEPRSSYYYQEIFRSAQELPRGVREVANQAWAESLTNEKILSLLGAVGLANLEDGLPSESARQIAQQIRKKKTPPGEDLIKMARQDMEAQPGVWRNVFAELLEDDVEMQALLQEERNDSIRAALDKEMLENIRLREERDARQAQEETTREERAELRRLRGRVPAKEALRKERARRRERQYRNKLIRQIMKDPSQAIAFEQASQIRDIQAQHYTNRSKRMHDLIEKMRLYVADEDLSGDLRRALQQQRLQDLPTEQLEEIRQQIRDLTEQGRIQRWLETLEEKAEVARLGRESIAEILNEQPLMMKELIGSVQQEVQSDSSLWTLFMKGSLRPARIARMLSGGRKGVVYDLLVREVNRATDAELRGIDRRTEAGFRRMEELGLRPADLQEVRATSKGEQFRVDDIISIYIAMQNPDSAAAIEHGNKIPMDAINRLINMLTPAEKAWGDWMIESFSAEEFDRILEVLVKDENRNAPRVERYFPMWRQGVNFEFINKAAADDIVKRTPYTKAYAQKNFTRSRIKIRPEHQTAIQLGATEIWHRAVAAQEKYVASGLLIKKLHRVFGNREVQQAIEQKWGKSMNDWIRKYINDIANPNIYRAHDDLSKLSRTLRQHAALSYLGLNFVTMLKQLPSMAFYLPHAGPAHMVRSIGQFLADPAGVVEFVRSRDPQVKHRSLNRFEEELKLMSQEGYEGFVRRTGSFTMRGIKLMDTLAVTVGWKATYDRAIVEGYSEQEAIEIAQQATLDTQPTARAKDLAEIYRSHEGYNWFLMFSNQLNQIWNMLVADMPMDAQQKQFGRVLLTMTGLAISAGVIGWLDHRDLPDEDEDDQLRRVAGKYVLNQLTSAVPVIGGSIKAGMEGWFGTGVDPFPIAAQAGRTGRTLLDAEADGGRKLDATVRLLMEGMVVSGLPTVQPRRFHDTIFAERWFQDPEFNPWELIGGIEE